MNNEPVAYGKYIENAKMWLVVELNADMPEGYIPLYTHPAKTIKDREADRKRFSDEGFNRWLDESISDSGHTVYDLVENVCEAWHGWENSQYYKPAKTKHLSLQKTEDGELVAVTYTDDEHRIIEVLWEKPPAKTLTDEEIKEVIKKHWAREFGNRGMLALCRAILRKAQEK